MDLNKKKLEAVFAEELAVIMAEETDTAFRSKSWAGTSWAPRRAEDIGSLLLRTGTLRRSIKIKAIGNTVVVMSEMPYANLHNLGGTVTIPVTDRMRAHFWAKFYKTKKERYKAIALALKKKNSIRIKIPRRQFAGITEQTEQKWEKIVQEECKRIDIAGAIKAHIKR